MGQIAAAVARPQGLTSGQALDNPSRRTLPPKVSFNIRAQFGAKPPQAAVAAVGQRPEHVATSVVQPVVAAAASSAKRSRMEGTEDVSDLR